MFDALKNLKDRAEDLAEAHGDTISEGLEKVGDFIDGRTAGKHSDKIDTAVDKAQDFVGKLGEKGGAGVQGK
ncbi:MULTISPECIES: antitoxin [unclassified Streptomyces]|uniref:antitoxin n=1 Tax=unclassified Streptomyces TaxID=2593676 RepID=UPI001F0495C1|nr:MULTISPECIES: antitoxin [unclassified Streptomyces]MCH0564174.1 antitoxin [Streptomyces sp. MUM 2J]MCH0568477.1 antitoxin [Streptomyces sp. MUM 136J]